MGFTWAEMWQQMGAPAIAVALVLLVMGLVSLTVFIERLITLARSRAASKEFAAKITADMQSGNVDSILATAELYAKHAYLARVVRAGLTTYMHACKTADISGLTPVERTQRHMTRYMIDVGVDLRRGLAALASVGSVAPFVGLLGTVIGIITAFQGIAATGSGGLSSVSAGISEALIETAFGLAVAIPSVLAFNFLSSRITRDETALNSAAGELLDAIEDWAEREAQGKPTGPLDGVKSCAKAGDGAAFAGGRVVEVVA